MKIYLRTTLLIFLLAPVITKSQSPVKSKLLMWYDKPAGIWEEALPLGNGNTGAMVFGKIDKERYQLNDNTLWSGYPQDGNNVQAAPLLPQLREFIFKGDYAGAEQTWRKMQGPYSARYLPLGDLWLDFGHEEKDVKAYSRSLDLKTAVASVRYTIDDVVYTRSTFINHPSKIMVVSIKSSRKGMVNLKAALSSKLKYTTHADGDKLVLKGRAPKYVAARDYFSEQVVYDEHEGISFEVQVKLEVNGSKAKVFSTDSLLTVTAADEVKLYLTEATSFNGYDKSPGKEGKDPSVQNNENLIGAIRKGADFLEKEHIKDYSSLFNRVSFELSEIKDRTKLPINERLKQFATDPTDLGLQSLYYQFGRYLLISGSRPGGRPTNLQGLWNDHIQPPWGSNYTININTEMNYWLAENSNLSECHTPLFDFIKELAVNGAKTARINYGIQEGWVAHHNSDLWAKTSPVGNYDKDKTYYPGAFCWQMGGAWLSTHLWEHFLYTRDQFFLKNEAYPLMKGAAQFMLHWLVKDPETGLLVTAPSTSPENVFKAEGKAFNISKASTMDISIVRQLFQDVIGASEALNEDLAFRNELKQALGSLYPFHIGKYGQIQEWYNDVDDPKDTHRHISHLYGLFPGNQISPERTKDLAEAAKVTLKHRGDVSTGWSMAWKMNWWARLKDGAHAYKILAKAFNYINPNDKTFKSAGGGGTYPNLFDAHPPFQIDGNFGATAGITEMLMQSHEGKISLLPALPPEWKDGAIKGIKARGNFELDIIWKQGKLKEAKIKSIIGGICKVETAGLLKVKELSKANQVVEDKMLSFHTQKGKVYTLVLR